MNAKTYIVSVSGGLGSFEALRRTIERHGKENTVAIFADVGVVKDELGRNVSGEDESLYTFLDDIERHLAIKILRLRHPHYTDIWDVFFKKKMMGSSLRDPCSQQLKRKQISDWMKDNNYTSENSVRVLGFGRAEAGRAITYERYMKELNWEVWFPLIDEPYCDNETIKAYLQNHSITLPKLYEDGFGHNNCGGFCVKMGLGQAYDLYKNYPHRYLYHESMEQKFQKEMNTDATIFRQRVKGTLVSITMKELRRRFEEENYIPRTAGLGQSTCGGRCMIPGSEMAS